MGNRIAELARKSGVVGAGGAGFPTHVKLNVKVDCVILNGAECEPLIAVDQMLLLKDAERLAEMLETVRRDLGAGEAVIAIKAKHKEAVCKAENAVKKYPNIRVNPLGDFYPAGDEYVLVYETTGKQIPQGGIPLECGAVVVNVETLWNLARAEEGNPVFRKWVTVAGAVKKPGTFFVPLGISFEEMIALAGGPAISDFGVINGGPMMGKLVSDLKEPVVKTTKGILVLPENNPVILNRRASLSSILRRALSMCCQCRMCTDLCPRNLLGYHINPNRTMLDASYRWKLDGIQLADALLCSECGACELYACPMGLSPRRVNQALKAELARQGVKNPYKGTVPVANAWRKYRRIPTTRLICRLGLEPYLVAPEVYDTDYLPDAIEIPLKQHTGVPSKPVVAAGDRVRAGDLVAQIPSEGLLGSNLFAGISGKVTEITDQSIRIVSAL